MEIFEHYKNAKAVIKQIKNNEWKFEYNSLMRSHPSATKDDFVLWVANGSWFCDINNKNAFGLILRHWVWFAAARKATIAADNSIM